MQNEQSRALFTICSLDLWERFSFHGMRAMLVLFLIASVLEGGFGRNESDALKLYGTYLSLVYIAPLVISPLVDRFLGHYRGIIVGASIILCGHVCLTAVHVIPHWFADEGFYAQIIDYDIPLGLWKIDESIVLSTEFQSVYASITVAFHVSLLMIIIGTGFFKSSAGGLISRLYHNDTDSVREAAFTTQYLVINIGAFAAPIAAGGIGEVFGWAYGFGVAAFGMGLGLLGFVVASKRFIPDELKSLTQRQTAEELTERRSTSQDTQRIFLLVMLVLILSVYWSIYEQWGGLINIFTDQRIDRSIGEVELSTSSLQSLNPLFIMVLAPLLVALSRIVDRKSHIAVKITPFHKLSLACFTLGATFVLLFAAAHFASAAPNGQASIVWLIFAYFFMALSELLLAPVALSLITRIAPITLVSIAVGVFYSTNSVGALISGYLGSAASRVGADTVFAQLSAMAIILAITTLFAGRLYGATVANSENQT